MKLMHWVWTSSYFCRWHPCHKIKSKCSKKPFFIWQQQTSWNKIHLENQQNSHLAIQMIAICKLKIILATKIDLFSKCSHYPDFFQSLLLATFKGDPTADKRQGKILNSLRCAKKRSKQLATFRVESPKTTAMIRYFVPKAWADPTHRPKWWVLRPDICSKMANEKYPRSTLNRICSILRIFMKTLVAGIWHISYSRGVAGIK